MGFEAKKRYAGANRGLAERRAGRGMQPEAWIGPHAPVDFA